MNFHMSSKAPAARVAAIHDLSGFGRCALTVVIPTLSAAGLQCVPMPTALLSTHTGGYSGFSFLDLTAQMERFSAHWLELGLTFDAVYSGFLGGAEQIDVVKRFIGAFRRPETLVLVDPVMGDDGLPYSTVTPELLSGMAELVSHADVITPNLTEAFFLLGRPVEEVRASDAGGLLYGLAELGPRRVVITGVPDGEGVATVSLDLDAGVGPLVYTLPRVPVSYPGTGDLFASVLLSGLLGGRALGEASAFASDFTREVMLDTLACGTPPREGVQLERNLWRLLPPRDGSCEK